MGAGASSNLPNSLTAQDLRALVDDEQHFSGCLAVAPWLAVSLRNGGRAKKADVLRAWRRYTASIAFPELVEELGADEEEEEEGGQAAAANQRAKCSANGRASATEDGSGRDASSRRGSYLGFLYFLRQRRPLIKGKNPGASGKEIQQLASEEWKQLAVNEKKATIRAAVEEDEIVTSG